MEVSTRVRELVRARFTEQDASDILQAFELADPPLLHPSKHERVQVAILKYSEYDSVKVMVEIDYSCIDWRDTLMAGGLADWDWPAVMESYLREALA